MAAKNSIEEEESNCKKFSSANAYGYAQFSLKEQYHCMICLLSNHMTKSSSSTSEDNCIKTKHESCNPLNLLTRYATFAITQHKRLFSRQLQNDALELPNKTSSRT